MNAKHKLEKSLGILFCLCLVSACGQQPAGAPQPSGQVQSSATQNKGQVAPPDVKPGKATDASGLLVALHGCADLVLSDSQQRKLGYDPSVRRVLEEIPGGSYDEGDPSDDSGQQNKKESCVSDKTLQIPQPLAGSYNVSLRNPKGRPFKLEITSYGVDAKENGHFVVSQPTGKGTTAVFQFQLPVSPSSPFEVKPISEPAQASSSH